MNRHIKALLFGAVAVTALLLIVAGLRHIPEYIGVGIFLIFACWCVGWCIVALVDLYKAERDLRKKLRP